jgi:hypothetical protein
MSNATPTPRDSTTAKAPQLRGWVEIFRTGTHKDSKGREFTASESDLDQIIQNHKLGAAPAVIGHPKQDGPAYAWVGDLMRKGASLFSKFADINPAFDDGVALGAYRNRSISLVRDPEHGLRLRHVGWLGAVPPAIASRPRLCSSARPKGPRCLSSPPLKTRCALRCGRSMAWAACCVACVST